MRAVLLASCLSLLGACGPKHASPAPKDWNAPAQLIAVGPPFAAPGERVRYRVSALNLEIAQMVIAVGEIAELDGKRAITLQAAAQSVGLAARLKPAGMEITSWLDVATGQPLLFRSVETAADVQTEQDEARFTQLANKMLPVAVVTPDAPEKIEQQVTNGQPQEMLGVLLQLRAWEGKKGDQRTFEAMRSKFMWRLQATIAGRESLSTALGELPTVKVEAITRRLMRDGSIDKGTEPRKFTVWVSDDADRVPLLMIAETDHGDVRLEIADYTAGSANLATIVNP
ncbi:MAG TPA: DUF3108 domain-containing protein [Kofleriaceae bacterium]|jgi:hypothetical protein